MKTTINLQDELIAENRKVLAADQAVLAQQAALDAETDKLVNAALDRATSDYETAKQKTLETLGLHYKLAEAKQVREKQSKWAHLPQERIFTKDAIKELCLKYNLRFLPTSYYKGELDSQLPDKLDELRKANGGLLPGETPKAQDTDGYFGSGTSVTGNFALTAQEQLNMNIQTRVWAAAQNAVLRGARSGITRWDHALGSFCIAAPAESFALQPRPIDPLLFCNLGDDQYYLVHKWGSDISWSRRWLKHWREITCRVLSIGTVVAGASVGPAFVLHFHDDNAAKFVAFGMTAIFGGFLASILAFGPPAIFSFITRNSKTTTTTEFNWDSPYIS